MTENRCPDCGNQRRPGRFHACTGGRLVHDPDDRMSAKDVHTLARETCLECPNCGSALGLQLVLQNATPEQQAEIEEFARVLGRYMEARLAKLVPIESMAEAMLRRGYRKPPTREG